MDRKTLLKDFAYKLRKVRESLKYTQREMADYFGTEKTNYTRYESGKIFPGFIGLYYFANSSGISLDWLVFGKGPRYYKEKLEEETDDKQVIEEKKVIEEKEEAQPVPAVKIPEGEIKELLEYMERIPYLRHEILVSFYKFKEEHKEIVKAADIGH